MSGVEVTPSRRWADAMQKPGATAEGIRLGQSGPAADLAPLGPVLGAVASA